jgi:hypothetical protein
MFFIVVMLLAPQFLYGSDQNQQALTNQQFLNLLHENDILDFSPGYGRHQADGGNLEAIESYYEKHKDAIILSPHLTYACKSERCSEKVVEFLCKNGANPNEKSSDDYYPGTCCLHTYEGGRNSDFTFVPKIQKKKFNFLIAALKNKQKLFIDNTETIQHLIKSVNDLSLWNIEIIQ